MLIGICGYRKTGKSTVADCLTVKYCFTRFRFAEPLKAMLRAIGLTDEQLDGHLKETPITWLPDRTPRQLMQWLGTEWGRDLVDPDLWVKLCMRDVESHLYKHPEALVMIDDVRFPNEVAAIRTFGGSIWRVSRPGCMPDGHVSESYIEQIIPDLELNNDDSIAQLEALIARAITG